MQSNGQMFEILVFLQSALGTELQYQRGTVLHSPDWLEHDTSSIFDNAKQILST